MLQWNRLAGFFLASKYSLFRFTAQLLWINHFFSERGECVPFRTDDAFLLRFLRARNFVVERAHRLVYFAILLYFQYSIFFSFQFVNYHEFKENNPEFFENVELLHLKKLGDNELITVPPYREQTGRRMLLYRMGKLLLFEALLTS